MKTSLLRIFAVVGMISLVGQASAKGRSALQVQVRKGPQAGTAVISINSVRSRGVQSFVPDSVRSYRLTVPLGVAKRFVKAADKGLITVNAQNDWGTSRLRLRAGAGKSAVEIRRSRLGGGNTSMQVELNGKSYWLSQTVAFHTGKAGAFTGRSGIFRTGESQVVNPETLRTHSASGKRGQVYQGSSLQWLMKSAPRSRLRSLFPQKAAHQASLDAQL